MRSIDSELKPFHANMIANIDFFPDCVLVSKQKVYQIMINKGAQSYFVEWTKTIKEGNA